MTSSLERGKAADQGVLFVAPPNSWLIIITPCKVSLGMQISPTFDRAFRIVCTLQLNAQAYKSCHDPC